MDMFKRTRHWTQSLFEFSSQFSILFTQHPFEHHIYIYAIFYKVFSHFEGLLLKGKGKAVPLHPRGFQEFKAPRFHDNGTGLW
jgi:hypothetical protein